MGTYNYTMVARYTCVKRFEALGRDRVLLCRKLWYDFETLSLLTTRTRKFIGQDLYGTVLMRLSAVLCVVHTLRVCLFGYRSIVNLYKEKTSQSEL